MVVLLCLLIAVTVSCGSASLENTAVTVSGGSASLSLLLSVTVSGGSASLENTADSISLSVSYSLMMVMIAMILSLWF